MCDVQRLRKIKSGFSHTPRHFAKDVHLATCANPNVEESSIRCVPRANWCYYNHARCRGSQM